MATFISHSADETEALGASWAEIARPGWVIGLQGDLGAGKTQLVRGLARALGAVETIHSPTFALIHLYQGKELKIFHLDFYRLPSALEIERAGLADYLQPEGIAVIEWFDRWDGAKPADFRRVQIDIEEGNQRRIVYEDSRA